MVARFRSLDTWDHIAQLNATAWEFPVFSANNKAGSLQVAGEHPELAMTWVAVGSRFFYVSNATPGSGMTKLTIKLPINAFSRDISFSPLVDSFESYIAGILTSAFKNQSDSVYAMPYLSISYSGTTSVTLACKEGEVVDFLSILQYAEEKGIEFVFAPGASSLGVTIRQRQTESHNLVLGDGHSQLKSYTRSYNTVDKITVRRVTVNEDETITVRSSEDWFALPDGTVSTTPPSPRTRGLWSIVSVEDDDIPLEDAAKEAIAQNKASYKLTFLSDMAFGLGDRITARFNGMLQTGELTSCTVSSSDPRFLYEVGTMPTTLTDKFTEIETVEPVEQPVTVENAEPEYLSRTGGSVGGDLSVTEALRAGKLVLSSSSYGTTLPSSGEEGQVFFLLS